MRLQQVGLQHPRVRQLRAVVRSSAPNRRGLFVAEGLWAHSVLLELDAPIDVFFWCPEAAYSDEARTRSSLIATRARHAFRISPRVLELLSERDRPDGLISLASMPVWDCDRIRLQDRALVLVADGIEIPGNLGTLLRTLDACGGDCLLLTNRRTRLSHPKVFRGSRGMSLRVPVVEFAEPVDAMRWLDDHGFAVCLATTSPAAVPYRQAPFGQRTALVVGNERCGISRPWRERGYTEITVPMLGSADSLNVSVCASILLYEARARTSGW
jgi:tRNA G18 (ribose-2'-O)-methylase SpoU